MKKFIYIIVLAVFMFLTGCDDSFNPKSEYQEKYVLSSVIQGSTRGFNIGVEVYLTKLYNVDGTNPYTNPDDPAVKNAVVQFLHRDKVYDLQLTTIQDGNPRYNSDMFLYSTSVVSPRAGDSVYVRAILPDGTRLSSSIQFPRSLHFELNYPYVRGYTSNIDQSAFGDALNFSWKGALEELYFPELVLNYQQLIDGKWVSKRVNVPSEILPNGTKVYPEYVYDFDMGFKYDAIDRTVASLGEGLENKSEIKLVSLYFKLESFERNLANYYSSTNGFLDSYSIRLDEEVFMNITGGLGIFGASIAYDEELEFDPGYVASYGYSN